MRIGVGSNDVDMAFRNSKHFEASQAAFNQRAGNTLAPMCGCDDKMLQITATPVMT